MENRSTNFFDVLIVIINGIFNLFKIEKVICLLFVYLMLRDFRLVTMLDENTDVANLLIDAKIIEYIFQNDNILITVLGCSVVFLLVLLIIVIVFGRKMYIKEIERLSEVRKDLMHGQESGNMENIKKHHSSNKKYAMR